MTSNANPALITLISLLNLIHLNSGLGGILKRQGGRFERFEYRVRAKRPGPRRTREALRIADIHAWERLTGRRHPSRDDGELAELERIPGQGHLHT
jgi:hypothetical protein